MANNSIDVRISQMVTAEIKRAVKEETVIGRRLDKEISRSTKLDEAYNSRLDSLESKVGNNNVSKTVEDYIVANITTAGTKVPTAAAVKSGIEGYFSTDISTTEKKVPTAATVKAAIDAITFTNTSDDNEYENQLYTLKDKDGNVLMYFDENGNLHVNGAVVCTNM